MGNFKLEVEGLEATLKKINSHDTKLRADVKQIVKNTSTSVKRDARSTVRVKKGTVQKAITIKNVRPKSIEKPYAGFHKTVHARRRPHAHLIEDGSNQRFHKSGKSTGRMPKNPYMKPAENNHAQKFNSDLKKVVNRNETV